MSPSSPTISPTSRVIPFFYGIFPAFASREAYSPTAHSSDTSVPQCICSPAIATIPNVA